MPCKTCSRTILQNVGCSDTQEDQLRISITIEAPWLEFPRASDKYCDTNQTNIIVKNPQSNSSCERAHMKVSENLTNIVKEDPARQKRDTERMIDNVPSTCVYFLTCAINHTMKTSMQVMIFNWNRFMDI